MTRYRRDTCFMRHPDRACLCTLPAGHQGEHHSRVTGASWGARVNCGAVHPYRKGVQCGLQEAHTGCHISGDGLIRWSNVKGLEQ